MNIGLLARADNGGIAAQAIEFAENLPIFSTLLVDLGDKGRGHMHNYDWPNCTEVQGPRIDDVPRVLKFLDGLDVVLSIETFYGGQVIELATAYGIQTVRYANPELYKNEEEAHVVLPTEWERDRLPWATVIPQGVSAQSSARVRTGPAKTLLHFTSPAMMDRNGTKDFHAAMSMVNESFRVIIVGPAVYQYERSQKHEWIEVTHYAPDRLGHYTDEVDLLVLPRKYGGLSLPMLEAASFGIPTLAPDLSPQNAWFSPDALVPIDHRDMVNMVGGAFNVYSIHVKSLADRLDQLAKEPLTDLSTAALSFAERNSWKFVAPQWSDYFDNLFI